MNNMDRVIKQQNMPIGEQAAMWEEWLEYRRKLEKASSVKEREKIEADFLVKYPLDEDYDADDDRVMRAGTLPDEKSI